jgi:protein translocase SecG subunit
MLLFANALLGALLSIAIMLQQRASGLSATFGGTGATYIRRRGAEALLFTVAIWLSVAFFGLGILQLFV